MSFDVILVMPMPKNYKPEQPSRRADNRLRVKVHSVRFGVENKISMGSASGGAAAGRAAFHPVTITKTTGPESAEMFLKLCQGSSYEELALEFVTLGAASGKSADPFYSVQMKKVFLQQMSFSGAADNNIPLEEWQLACGALQISYRQRLRDGSLEKEPVSAAWSMVLNISDFRVE
jgi:type VI secretion system secreted protein Hcp